jgi:hypothetical protein
VFTVHATKKLLDRVKQRVGPPVTEPASALGNWYASALFWKPQVVLLVNELTLLPVLMPLAPAATVLDRFPSALAEVLAAHGALRSFISAESEAMAEGSWAKTQNRSVVGIMNEFTFMAERHRDLRGVDDLVAPALWLAQTPCSPLDKRHGSPDRELHALLADLEWG